MPRTTLTIEGLPDGDEANTVTVKYTKPVADSSAWLTDTFTAIDEYVDSGAEPIISTALDLPGVYRKEEASNKAILKLRRSNNRQRISFVAVDEGIMFQPGDVLEINDSNRGITGLQIFVESAVMIDYGRWRISGVRYRDTDYSDECYVDEDDYGKWVDVLGPPVITVDCLQYACDAFETQANAVGVNSYWPMDLGDASNLTDQVGSVDLTDVTPIGDPDYQYPSLLDNCTNYSTYIVDRTGSEWLSAASHPYVGPNLTIGGVFKAIKGGTIELIEANARNNADNYVRLRVSAGTLTAEVRTSTVPYTGAFTTTVSTAITANAQGVFGAAVTLSYNAASDETTIRLYPNFVAGSPESEVHTGRYGDGVPSATHRLFIGKNGGVAFEKVFAATSALGTGSMSALANALNQNFTDYVDPNCA